MRPPLQNQSSHQPLIYLITSGQTSAQTTPHSKEFAKLLKLIEAAVVARIDLVQIREKELSAKTLYELALQATRITRYSNAKLLVNDRADIAVATGADGVHLRSSSLPVSSVREAFGKELLIGVSTHSLDEARTARDGGADFVVYGPVFKTMSKIEYGQPVGTRELAHTCSSLAPFPVLALGGVTLSNAEECVRAGASGVAAIQLLNDAEDLGTIVNSINQIFIGRGSGRGPGV